jgi:hypothetical protein
MSTYYEHPESGATQWARPTSVTASAAQWELHYDAKRNTYFHNNETGESSWELPAGAALLTMREDSVDDDADAVQGAGESMTMRMLPFWPPGARGVRISTFFRDTASPCDLLRRSSVVPTDAA